MSAVEEYGGCTMHAVCCGSGYKCQSRTVAHQRHDGCVEGGVQRCGRSGATPAGVVDGRVADGRGVAAG